MQLSSRSDYGVRALLELALVPEGEAVPLADIATRTNIPFKYLERIFRLLRDVELIRARRGHSGGYVLARPAEEITVADVIRVLDGPVLPSPCAGAIDATGCPSFMCPNQETCVLRDLWLDVADAISDVLDNTTFADLADRMRAQPREHMPVIDVYAQPPEARRRHRATRAGRDQSA